MCLMHWWSWGSLPVDLNISSRAPVGLPSVRHRGPSGLNLLLQAKVTGSVLSKKVHCTARSLSSINIPGLRPVLGASEGACGADHAQRMPLQAVLNTVCSGTVCAMCSCERDAEHASGSVGERVQPCWPSGEEGGASRGRSDGATNGPPAALPLPWPVGGRCRKAATSLGVWEIGPQGDSLRLPGSIIRYVRRMYVPRLARVL